MEVFQLRKILCILLLTSCMSGFLGCGSLLENVVSDVGGWDVSACVDGFGTCFELFRDNADKFEGGFAEALNGLP